jgi:hypothetical protein
VEEVLVLRDVDRRVLQERERAHVRRGELLAHQVVATGKQVLEDVHRDRDLPPPLLDPLAIGIGFLHLVVDEIGRALPDAVEPIDEHGRLGAARGVLRVQRRLRIAAVQMLDDDHRVPDDRSLVVDHRHEVLTGDAAHQAAILRVDPDRLDGQILVGERERDPLDVRGELESIELDHASAPARTLQVGGDPVQGPP